MTSQGENEPGPKGTWPGVRFCAGQATSLALRDPSAVPCLKTFKRSPYIERVVRDLRTAHNHCRFVSDIEGEAVARHSVHSLAFVGGEMHVPCPRKKMRRIPREKRDLRAAQHGAAHREVR
jgi:hypothetical protein